MLALPKFRERQSQIERQFQARERSGHVVSAGDGYSPLSTTSKTMLTLKPLVFVLCIALFATTLFFWLRRFNFFGRTTVAAESDFAETREEEAH